MVVDYLRTLGQWQAMTKLEVKSRYDYSKRKLVPLANSRGGSRRHSSVSSATSGFVSVFARMELFLH